MGGGLCCVGGAIRLHLRSSAWMHFRGAGGPTAGRHGGNLVDWSVPSSADRQPGDRGSGAGRGGRWWETRCGGGVEAVALASTSTTLAPKHHPDSQSSTQQNI